MLNQANITLSARLTRDPELRFTPSGKPVANLDIAHNPRTRNSAGEWEDGTPLWLELALWANEAETACEKLKKGDRIIITGALGSRIWTDRAGVEHTKLVIQPEQVSIPLVTRADTPKTTPVKVDDPWDTNTGGVPPF